MIDPLDDPDREAWRLRTRQAIVAALTWSPRLPPRLVTRGLVALAGVALALVIALHNHWIGAGWASLAHAAVGASGTLTGLYTARTIKRRRLEKTGADCT